MEYSAAAYVWVDSCIHILLLGDHRVQGPALNWRSNILPICICFLLWRLYNKLWTQRMQIAPNEGLKRTVTGKLTGLSVWRLKHCQLRLPNCNSGNKRRTISSLQSWTKVPLTQKIQIRSSFKKNMGNTITNSTVCRGDSSFSLSHKFTQSSLSPMFLGT